MKRDAPKSTVTPRDRCSACGKERVRFGDPFETWGTTYCEFMSADSCWAVEGPKLRAALVELTTAEARWREVPARSRHIVVNDLLSRADLETGAAHALRDHPAAAEWRLEVADALRALVDLTKEIDET